MNHTTSRLIQAFGSLTHPASVYASYDSDTSEISQTDLIQVLLHSSHYRSYPPSESRRRKFWRWIIDKIEASGEEVDEAIYEEYLSLLKTPGLTITEISPTPPLPCYTTYYWAPETTSDFDSYRRVTLLTSLTTIESGTTGLTTWPASYYLAEYIIRYPDYVKGKSVLELGSGTGLLGIVAAQIQALDSTPDKKTMLCLTDVNSTVLLRCEANIHIAPNGPLDHRNIIFKALDWTDSLSEQYSSSFMDVLDTSKPEVILGADLVYDPSIIPALTATLSLALSRTESPTVALIAITVRRSETIAQFEQYLNVNNIEWETVAFNEDEEKRFGIQTNDQPLGEVRLYRMTMSLRE